MKILVFVEHSHGKIKRSSIELLQFARKAGAETHALAMGPDAPSLAAEAGQNGAQSIHVFADASLKDYNSELYTKSIAGLISEIKPRVVLAAAGSLGRDLFPRIAAKLNLGIASDCVEIALTPQLSAKKPLYSGKCFAKVSFQGEDPHIVLMRPNQLPVEASSGAAAQVVNHTSPASADLKTVLKEIVKGASEKLDLTEANIIVSGGRGLKDAANFKLLNDLEIFRMFGLPVLTGVSRKSLICKVLKVNSDKALNGTSVLNTIALLHGAAILRVHDVREAMETIQLTEELHAAV